MVLMVLMVELRGESFAGEHSGEGGMRRRRSPVGERADLGRAKGEGGIAAIEAEAGGDLSV
jgi:hypothetical protein